MLRKLITSVILTVFLIQQISYCDLQNPATFRPKAAPVIVQHSSALRPRAALERNAQIAAHRKASLKNIFTSCGNNGVIILFVCTANEIRSVLMERHAWELIMRNGLRDKVVVMSAGTSPRARERLDKRLVELASVIIVAEDFHRRVIIHNWGPEIGAKTFLFNELLPREDPLYGMQLLEGPHVSEIIKQTLEDHLLPLMKLIAGQPAAPLTEGLRGHGSAGYLASGVLRPLAWEEREGGLTGSQGNNKLGSTVAPEFLKEVRGLIRKRLMAKGIPAAVVSEMPDEDFEVYAEGLYRLVIRISGWKKVYKVIKPAPDGRPVKLYRYVYGDIRTDQELSAAINEGQPDSYPLAASVVDLSEGNVYLQEQRLGLDLKKILEVSFKHTGRDREKRETLAFEALCEVAERSLASGMLILDLNSRNVMYIEVEFKGAYYLVPVLSDLDDALKFSETTGMSVFNPNLDVLNKGNLAYFIHFFMERFIRYRNDIELEKRLRENFIRVAEEDRFPIPAITDLLRDDEKWRKTANALAKVSSSADLREWLGYLSDAGLDHAWFVELKKQLLSLSRQKEAIRKKYQHINF